MPIHSNTDPEHVWPLTLPVEARTHLATIKAAHADATAAWKLSHPGSRQDCIPHRDFLDLIGLKLDHTILSRLLSDKGYPAATAAGYLLTIHAACQQWQLARALAQRMPQRATHLLPFYEDMAEAAAISSALEEQSIQERAVVFLAPTGGGKTTLARHLRDHLGRCFIISAHESWRTSYFAVLGSILKALGQKAPPSATKAEEAVLTYLTQNKVTLIFDEQDFFGRSALNLIRQLLNETRTSVVMLMVPETWDRLVRDGGEYASQFCRRCGVLKKAPALTTKDALIFLRESLPDAPAEGLAAAAKVLATEANIFGAVSLLDNAARALGNITLEPGETLAAKALQIAAVYRQRHQLSLNIAA